MIKGMIKAMFPRQLLEWRRRRVASRNQLKFSNRSAAETFSEIYASNLWGGEFGQFYSGEGSTGALAKKYGDAIRKFVTETGVRTVVDLGCGDFRVAREFVKEDIVYIGIDVVEPLIELNKKKFGTDKICFERLDIVEEPLPYAELCLIRQVLQHLSNAEISKILEKCCQYPFVIVTEHYPNPQFKLIPNLDIPHGPGIRVYYNSAVVLDKPPFNIKNLSLWLQFEGGEGTEVKSFLITNSSPENSINIGANTTLTP